MHEVSLFRLYLLRATYLLIALAMGSQIWPGLLGGGSDDVAHMTGVVRAMLGALTILALLGVRHPLAMLPLLFWELAWKLIWVAAIGLPLWSDDRFTPAMRATWGETLFGVVLLLVVMPWGHVYRRFITAGGDRWRNARRREPSIDGAVVG